MHRSILGSASLALLLLVSPACFNTGYSEERTAVMETEETPDGIAAEAASEHGQGASSQAGGAEQDEEPQEESAEKKRLKIDDLKRRLEIARGRLEIAHMEVESTHAEQAAREGFAKREIALVEMRLKKFEDIESPNLRAQSELSLRSVKERAAETAEELKQLEIMYEEQDLMDMTREFVMERGRRRAALAAERIVIQERDSEGVIKFELPAKRAGLDLELAKAQDGLKSLERSGRIARLSKTLGEREAEAKIIKMEAELAELTAEGQE